MKLHVGKMKRMNARKERKFHPKRLRERNKTTDFHTKIKFELKGWDGKRNRHEVFFSMKSNIRCEKKFHVMQMLGAVDMPHDVC
jgi:hypothetical protein